MLCAKESSSPDCARTGKPRLKNGVELGVMSLDDYKVVLYRNYPAGWVAEVPSIPGCYALMSTPEEALTELAAVFQMISEEYAERKEPLPADTTEILHA